VRICQVSAELAPFAKTGGLGDVVSALTRWLGRAGHDVRTFVPRYSSADLGAGPVHPVDFLQGIEIAFGPHRYRFSVSTTRLPGSEQWVYLVDCPALYHRPRIYTSDDDEHRRFALLTRAALESCQRMGWAPEIAHAHDWHAALLPLYLRTAYSWDRLFGTTRTVLTLHNVGYQGVFSAAVLGELGFGEVSHLLHQEDLAAGRLNFLKAGILYADALTTVSVTHAEEIRTPQYGFGLDDLLRRAGDKLVGIVNGIDDEEWDPANDPLIPHPYDARDLSGKVKNTRALLESLGLEYRHGTAVLGVVSRLTYQKGFDLAFDALPEALAARDLRLVALGTGESRYERFFAALAHRFPDKARHVAAYSNELAHRIEAGADIFLMPSRYEPCGLNQMYSLRYGTPPVVRRTGGLADTVSQWNPSTGEGTGFIFEHVDARGFRWALGQALAAFADRKGWQKLMRNGMAQDFSWRRQIGRYVELYERLRD
jgi:starch synthase